MTKSTITRDELNEVIATYGKHHIAHRMANALLAAMDSEPVAENIRIADALEGLLWPNMALGNKAVIQAAIEALRTYHAQPAPEREKVRREHAEWSQATFGNVGPVGPLKHLSKEALEAAAEPGDLSEWADMQFLLWDAQRRASITDEQITLAMIEKLAVNKQREWPEPKDGEPRLHIKEQPAPVVPNGLRLALSNAGIAAPESDEMLAATCEKHIQALVTWVKDRKPFQSAPVVPSFEEWLSAANQKPLGCVKDAMREEYDACRAAMLQTGISAVIPDGYVLVPREPTEEMNKSGWAAMNEHDAINPTYRAMIAAATHDAPALHRVQSVVTVSDRWIPVSERMPDDDDFVYIWPRPDFGVDLHVGQYCECSPKGEGWYAQIYEQNYGVDWHPITVTHWMPLPAAPQEVKGE